MSLVIRPLQSHDLPLAAQLIYDSWKHDFSLYMPAKKIEAITLESTSIGLQRVFANAYDQMIFLAAFENNTLLAMITAGTPREDKQFDAEVWAMQVGRDARRKGIGEKLFTAVMKALRDKGAKNLYLYCIDRNLSACRFYDAMGGVALPERIVRDGYQDVKYVWHEIDPME